MSTPQNSTTQAASPEDVFLQTAERSEVRTKPRRLVSFRVTGIEDAKPTGGGAPDDPTTGTYGYQRARITIEATRGSAKFFPAIMFRTEMFDPGFKGSMYTDYQKFPQLAIENPNSRSNPKGTKGKGMKYVFENNVYPTVSFNANGSPQRYTKGPHTGEVKTSGPSMLQMCCGGTLAGLGAFKASLDASYKGTEHTVEDIIGAIRSAIQANATTEHIGILKQGTDKSGDLSDNFELDRYSGVLTQELYDDFLVYADKLQGQFETDKEAGKPVDPGKLLTISFQV